MFGEWLPELPATEAMADKWAEVGCARFLPTGGFTSFEWQEVAAYSNMTGEGLSPIEARTLVEMSSAYARGLADTNPLSIAPIERGDYD